jgi:hypothetical protein
MITSNEEQCEVFLHYRELFLDGKFDNSQLYDFP